MQTLYILSYSVNRIGRCNHASDRFYAARSRIPAHAKRISTIRCRTWPIPPRYVCRSYSGVSEVVQWHVFRDPQARHALEEAFTEILRAFQMGYMAVKLETCCGSGTHRSVAAAEVLADRVEEMGYGVVVEHVHRDTKPGDER